MLDFLVRFLEELTCTADTLFEGVEPSGRLKDAFHRE